MTMRTRTWFVVICIVGRSDGVGRTAGSEDCRRRAIRR